MRAPPVPHQRKVGPSPRRVRSGVFVINATFPCLAAPFGGVKQSGFGREGGPEGLFALTQVRAITLDPAASGSKTTKGRS